MDVHCVGCYLGWIRKRGTNGIAKRQCNINLSRWKSSSSSRRSCVIDDKRPPVILHSQMISRRRSRFHHSVGSHLIGLGSDHLFPQSRWIIVDGHRRCVVGHDSRRLGRRITRRRLGATDKCVGHIDSHFSVRSSVVSGPVVASFATVTGAATTHTPSARSTATTYTTKQNTPKSWKNVKPIEQILLWKTTKKRKVKMLFALNLLCYLRLCCYAWMDCHSWHPWRTTLLNWVDLMDHCCPIGCRLAWRFPDYQTACPISTWRKGRDKID